MYTEALLGLAILFGGVPLWGYLCSYIPHDTTRYVSAAVLTGGVGIIFSEIFRWIRNRKKSGQHE